MTDKEVPIIRRLLKAINESIEVEKRYTELLKWRIEHVAEVLVIRSTVVDEKEEGHKDGLST